jgi:NADP-dependent 3-hydroxy acid dehydrogenase YdfG
MRELADQVLIVTGAGGAIAAPIVDALADAGARLALVDTEAARVEERARRVGGLALGADLTTVAGAEGMVREVTAQAGRVDGLVHTVGGFAMGRLAEVDPAVYDRMFDLNVRSLFYAVRSLLPQLLERGSGFICGISSEPGFTGAAPGSALYGAAKSAVATLLRSLDRELAHSAVRVTIVYPMGAVDTPANRREMPDADPTRWIDPAEIGQAIRFAAGRSPRGRLLELPIYPPR